MTKHEPIPIANPHVDELFADAAAHFQDLVPDDVILHPIATDTRANDVNLDTRFTEHIILRSPFASAAMDTVTTSTMGIAQAKEGNIGVLHAGMSPQMKKEEARSVKLELNGIIESPVCAREGQTVQSLLKECVQNSWEFRTFPVVDNDGVLRGMLTNHELRFWVNNDQTVHDLMKTTDIVSAHKTTDIETAYHIMLEERSHTLPLVTKRGKVKGLYIWSDVERLHSGNPHSYALDAAGHLLVAAAVGTYPERAAEDVEIAQKYVDAFVIDSSHGNSRDALETLQYLRHNFGDEIQIVAGNIVDGASALRLAAAGASAIKVGIGSGAICTTRLQTGGGMGQLSAVYECYKALRSAGYDIPIISDGGIRHPGDAAKVLAVGAEVVMMGSAFAGTEETPGNVTTNPAGATVKEYRGMGSTAAQQESKRARGYTSGSRQNEIFSEGVVAQIEYKGPVSRVIFEYKAGVRNAIANANALTIPEFQSNVRLGRVTVAGTVEASPHIGQTGRITSN